jgi:hypothetical protein
VDDLPEDGHVLRVYFNFRPSWKAAVLVDFVTSRPCASEKSLFCYASMGRFKSTGKTLQCSWHIPDVIRVGVVTVSAILFEEGGAESRHGFAQLGGNLIIPLPTRC